MKIITTEDIYRQTDEKFDIEKTVAELSALGDPGISEFSADYTEILRRNNLHDNFTASAFMRRFYLYYLFLTCENKKYNLTNITDRRGVIAKHFADCAFLPNFFDLPKDSLVADVGSGAGFPGAPLHILNESGITYIDSTDRKIMFIRRLTSLLACCEFLDFSDEKIKLVEPADETAPGEANARIRSLADAASKSEHRFISARAEEAARETAHREHYRAVISRAVAPMNVLCELCAPLLETGGVFYAMKAKNADAELAEAKRALQLLCLEVTEIRRYSLDTCDGEEPSTRTIIAMRKTGRTSTLYPRTFAKISKTPL